MSLLTTRSRPTTDVPTPSRRAQVASFLVVGTVTTALYSAVFALAEPQSARSSPTPSRCC